MQIDLSGRTALVTGGSLGIGRAIAERFGKSGADVVIVSRRKNEIDRTIDELKPVIRGRIAGYSCDVSRESEVDATFEKITADVGGIDILVNNAGHASHSPLLGLTREMLLGDLELKLFAAVQFSRLTVPYMKTRRWGRILNTVTISAKTPGPASGPTTLSRAAGLALIKSMSQEFAADNILVNGLCVGLIKSDQWVREHREKYADITYAEYLEKRAKEA
ncbi:MAG TPA: SDR family NAD(P)-dependent oxidoreductase, partial [Pseudorhodoplanes sp.]|nr:SDR family NAD(P)-dependent oxidoreductase [Pseudorhodoplanes sp.]